MYLDHSLQTQPPVMLLGRRVPVVTVVALMVETVVHNQMAAQLEMTLLNHYLQGLALVFCLRHWIVG